MAIHPGWFDRSPCGTGTCARMAQLHARGELPLDQDFVNESFIGTRFIGRLIGETTVGGRRGRAHGHRPGLDHRHGPVPARPRGPVPRRVRVLKVTTPAGSGELDGGSRRPAHGSFAVLRSRRHPLGPVTGGRGAAAGAVLPSCLDPAAGQPRTAMPLTHGEFLMTASGIRRTCRRQGAHVVPHNKERNLPRIQGLYTLFDAQTGTPTAVLDGSELTAVRTAAVSLAAVMDRLLADLRKMAVPGPAPRLAAICALC